MKRFLIVDSAALAIIVGIVPLIWLTALPSWLALVGIFPVLLLLLLGRTPLLFNLLIVGVSFIVATTTARQFQSDITQIKYDGGYISITAQIESPELFGADNKHIVARVISIEGKHQTFLARLSWKNAPPLLAGEQWQFTAKLYPVSAQINQGGFDAQRWMISNHIQATGIIKTGHQLAGEPSLRQRLMTHSIKQMQRLPNADVLVALAFGERALISDTRWQIFQYSGIAHLMAISGLHVMFAGLCGFMLMRVAQYLLPAQRIKPAIPLLAMGLAAIVYVWIAGWALPAERTLLAMLLVMLARYGQWQLRPVTLLLCVMAMLLLLDPLTVLSDSFWLSCLAVTVLMILGHFFPLPVVLRRRIWLRIPAEWVHVQIGLTLLLAPVQLAMFHGIPLHSFWANLIAIPLVTFVTVPLILAALLLAGFPALASVFWALADDTITLLWQVVTPLATQWHWLPQWSITLSIILFIVLFLWRLHLYRAMPVFSLMLLGVIAAPLFIPSPRWRVDMLDIGQGLAVVLSRNGHAIVYDTGSSWQGSSMAKSQILPFLHWQGWALDGVILSHQDNDHAGGLDDLLRAFPRAWVRSSGTIYAAEPNSKSNKHHLGDASQHLSQTSAAPVIRSGSCHRGNRWTWQQLGIEAVWPLTQVEKAGNADSCTLLVTDGTFRLLLTGDIEKAGEQALLNLGDNLQADIMTIPHHGSQTSSTSTFLQAVNPDYALVSAGRFNQWHHPRANIIARYRQQQISVLDTIASGQITVFFYNKKYQIKRYRQDISPTWYHQQFGSFANNRSKDKQTAR
ncbi:MAG: DNA internalization-related competence protein ComEC/Rec2 [Plesiomonas sp.]|uniref:DNA internalization-related competence protein ComEC/Rec2 n=1 Tax=Plesiomonas sp. TaxID=2486279 RepID=UPI003F3163AD